MSNDIIISNIEPEIKNDTNVYVSDNSNDIIVEDIEDKSITIGSNEFAIVADDIYIPSRYEDAPVWMKNQIQAGIDIAKTSMYESFDSELTSRLSEFATSYVPENQYTMSIISEKIGLDGRINEVLETLDTKVGENEAKIITLNQTLVDLEQSASSMISGISSNFDNFIGTYNNFAGTVATNNATTTQEISILNSRLNDANNNISGSAQAISGLRTYVGVDPNGGATGTGLLAKVEILQKQNDGVINTFTGVYDVMEGVENPNNNTDNDRLLTNVEPYSLWIAQDLANGNNDARTAHIGDVYIKYNLNGNGTKEYIASFKFIRTIPDSTSPYSTDSEGFTWAVIIDQAAQDAYVAALNAWDLADDKRRVYVGLGVTNTPATPYEQGDLWLIDTARTVNGYSAKVGDILRCIESKVVEGATYEQNDWVLASSYANAIKAEADALENWKNTTYANTITTIQTQVDKKAETFYQSSVPTGRATVTNVVADIELDKYIGDLWKNTYAGTVSGYLGNNTEYIYSKIANGPKWDYKWVRMEVPDIVFDTIDTKKSIYSGNSVPVIVAPDELQVNDMWITGDNPVAPYVAKSIYVWNGTAWALPLRYTDDTAVTALQTGLANGTTTIKLTNAYVGTVPLTTYLSSEIDNKVGVYSGTTAPVAGQPSGVAVNDIYLWFTTQVASGKTYDITRTYKYSGSAWNEITTNDDITNLADLADGKRTIFGGNVVPTGAIERDLWIPSANVSSYVKGEIYQYISGVWGPTTRYTADIQALTSNVQAQIDSKVDTYYQDTVPFANATNVVRKTQAGDYWYCTLTAGSYIKGKMYKYVETANGSKWNYTWTETADVTKYVFDIADGKASIFTSTNVPTTGYKVNDMLIVIGSFNNGTTTFSDGVVLSSNATRTTGFTRSDWVKKINDTEDLDDFVGNIYEPEINTLKAQVDAKIEYWFQTTDPKSAWTTDEERAKHNGDVWYNTSTKVSQYYSSSTNSWNLISDQAALDAITAANAARQLADSKVEVRYGTAAQRDTTSNAWTAAEKTSNIGDLWIISDAGDDQNKQFRWTGTGWLDIRDKKIISNASAITQLRADVVSEAGLRASGDTAVTNTVKAYADSVGAGVETKWAYNSNVNIGGVSYNSGFGLATSLTAGSGLTTGQSEFWIKADKFKLMSADGTKKSSYSPFTVDATTGDITFNGKVSFNSVTNVPSISSNLLYNSEPSLYGGTKGYVLGYNDTGITAVVGQHVSDWAPSGSSSVYIYSTGTPAPNTVFDINSEERTPIVGGKTYCAYAYFGAHRCTAQLLIGFYDTAGAIISYTFGNEISGLNGGKSLSNYGQSVIKVVAPSNAASVLMIYRGKNTTSANPYVFVVRSYLGVIDSVNSETPEWSEGTSVMYTPSNVVSDINNGNTTTINGGRITTGSVTANQINTTGLIAENISANEIVGKTITGGVINGARINGAVIKASYLDLDGDLEVLTNYIITVAMYNANPSLYTDAIYISADNQYRIPSLSTVRESVSSINNSYNGAIFKSLIRSYNCGISNSNLKAVKILPTVDVSNDTIICNVYNCKLLGSEYYRDYRSATVSIMVGNGVSPVSICIGRRSQSSSDDASSWGSETVKLYINNTNVFQTYDDWSSYGNQLTFPGHAGYFFSINGLAFKATVTSFNSFTVTLLAGSYEMQSNFNDITASLIQVTTIIGAEDPFWTTNPNPVAIISTSSSIYINNMI